MFNKRVKIKDAVRMASGEEQITVMGWVRTFRNNQFIALNDGSSNDNLQVVLELGRFDETLLKKITTGASIKAVGRLLESPGKGQNVELKAESVEILGESDPESSPCSLKSTAWSFCGRSHI